MNSLNIKIGTVLALVILLMGFTLPPEKITVYLIGDSTMADKERRVYPETGWGTSFKTFFDSTVVIENHARNGRSTKSFRAENLWQPIEARLQPGEYVFIQFGHNDEVKSKVGRYTTPAEYKENLTRYVTETRAKGALPVLLTPVTRRRFDEAGHVEDTHPGYSEIVRDLARDLKVPLIDHDRLSQALLAQFGAETSALLYLHMAPGEHPNYPKGREDNTHFSTLGARKMAQLVWASMQEQSLPLAARSVNAGKP